MFPYDDALVYARLLIDKADALERVYDATSEATGTALLGWRGRYAIEMLSRRLPEEHADLVAVALFGLRHEADQWAEAWADAVNEHNRAAYRRALSQHRQLSSEAAGAASLAGTPAVILPPAEPNVFGPPSGPTYTAPAAFVAYRFQPSGADGGGTWLGAYNGTPTGGGWGGWS